MSDNFRVAECLATPSQQFCIYDYTKIAYLIGNYLCIRQVVTPDSKPTFIELENYSFAHAHSQKYIGIISYPNCLVLAERAQNRDIILHFYNQDEQHIKIPSEIGRKAEHESQLKVEMYHSSNFIYLVVKRQWDVEILVVNYASRCFAGRGFVSGDVGEFKIKAVDQLELFSIFMKDTQQIIQYEVCSMKNQEHAIKIIQKNHWEMKWKDLIHCWTKQQLVVAANDYIHIFVESKQVQTIQGFKNIHLLTPTASGFMASNNSHLRIYKKNSSVFDFKTEYSMSHHPSSRIELSPQEDMLAFYEERTKSICYSINYDSQEEQKQKNLQELPLMLIEHHIENQVKTYSSAQSLMVVTSGSIISVISPISFQCYLSMRANIRQPPILNQSKKMFKSTSLLNEKLLSEIGEGQPIETVGIHPVQPIIGVAFRSLVRIYSILYNEFKIIKEIQMSHCKEIGFNNSGSIMYSKVGGKQGNKIYLYNTLQNFECIEILSAGRPIECMKWSHLDHTVYGFHKNGYYSWSIESFFKQRNESTVQIGFPVKGAEIYYNSVLIWGQKDILQIQNNTIVETIKTQKILTNLIVQNNNLLFTSQGELFRCKGLNNINLTLNNSGFKVPEGIKLYTVKSNVLLSLTSEGNIFCYEWGVEEKNHLQLVSIERKKIDRYQNEYKRYEETITDLEEQLTNQVENIREEFSRREHQQRQHFLNELKDREDRYLSIRSEKVKIEQAMEENMTAHEQQTMLHVKEIERIYERKIAITTNKLLTSEEIGFRNQMLAKENLHFLEQKHSENIYEVRNQYSKTLEKQLKERDVRDELYSMKKQYETKLSELQQQNQNLLKRFQSQTQNNIINLKKNVVNLELKYSEAISQKYNLTKEFEEQRIQLDVLRSKNEYVSERLQEEIRRGEQLSRQYSRIQALIVQKEGVIVCLEKRIQDLEKSNEIFKYRIIQMKNLSDPKEEEILKLKDNMIELEEEYEKIVKKAMQYEQIIALLKKDVNQLKQSLAASQLKQRKIDKSYATVMDKLREATKSPIQEIRRMLIRILDDFDNPGELRAQQEQKRSNSPLGELNRVREHLQVCLIEAVETGKKNDKQKHVQIARKNRQNSELLREINDLRVKVRDLEAKLKERQVQLQQAGRESRQFTNSLKGGKKQDRPSTNFQSQNRQAAKNKTRQSFYQRSLFKNNWRQKRLKTEQGSRTKKSSHSFVKQDTHPNHLYIESKTQEVEELRRLLDQKETIIKQLINKIHKLS